MVISIFKLPEDGKSWAEQKTGDICDCISLEYEKFFNGVGTFTAEVPVNTRFRDMLEVNSVLVTDSGDALIVKNIKSTLDKITLTGYDLNGLLCDRLTITDKEDGYDTQEGASETIIKHFVSANLADCELDPNRNLPRFGVAADKKRGLSSDSAMPRLENVQKLVTEICGAAKLGWRVSVNGSAANDKPIFVFDVAEQVDRSANQSERNRVIFSAQTHNISTMTREVGVTAAKNALFLDIDGTVVQYPKENTEETAREVFSGYDRREEYCSLTTDSLDEKDYVPEAEQNMSDRMNETDSLTIEAGNPLDYGTLYDVGTIVTVYDRKRRLELDSVISAVTIRRSGSEYSVKLTLGESKPKILDQYQKRSETTQKTVRQDVEPKLGPAYSTHTVTNAQPLKFDSIERGLLSVDFKVDSADSDVLFSGSQLCSISGAGTVGIVYKVDGAPQDFKPEQLLTAGKHVIAHAFPMALAVGKHNFAVCMLSDGRGFTDVGALRGALSGCISGMKNITPPNENLVFYYSGLPAGEFSLPAGIISGSGKKYVDWGDGSAVEESASTAAVTHAYAEGGDYTITIKTDSVKFGGSYKVVAASGFESYLTRVYFPDNAGTIEFSSGAQKLPNLETLVFGTSATKVYWSFGSACNVTSLLLPDTVQNVNFPGFDKTKVVLFVVPQSVTSILNGLVAPMTLRTLERYDSGGSGVSSASGLESLTIGGNATKTGTYLNASKLSSVTFSEPSKITEITKQAFDGCSSLPKVALPSTVNVIGSLAFRGCAALKSVNVPAGVTAIEGETFRNCSALAAIDLPGVTQIGGYAFSGCKSLTSAGLHEGLTKISQYAFNNCAALSEITFPSTLTTVGQYAFSGCTTAFSPGTAARIVTVGSYAFQNSGITEFTVYPETVLGSSAFYGCSMLANLEIQEGITYIPSSCFRGTTSLGVVTFPASLLKIEDYAFLGSSVTPIFPEGLVTIGQSAFKDGLADNMNIPESVTEIGGSAFSGNSMRSLTIGGNPNVGSNAFQGCKSLVSANISQLGVVPQSCFSGCSKLTSVSFKGGVRIGYSAFAGCGFTSLNVLSYLAEAAAPTTTGGNYDIGGGAFQNCKSLLSVDGYEYKWDVYLKAVYGSKDSDGSWSYQTVYTKLADGIYNYMGATDDNVFAGTALKTASSYPKDEIPANVTTSDYTERYSVINWTSSGAPG